MTDTPRLDRVPPQDVDSEIDVLGAMMMNDGGKLAIVHCMEILNKDDFYKESHRKIFDAITALFEDGQEVDIRTTTNMLIAMDDLEKVGGVGYLNQMMDSVPTTANAHYYAEKVKAEADRRAIIYAAAKSADRSYDETEDVEQVLSDAIDELLSIKIGVMKEKPSFKKQLTTVFKDMQERAKDPQSIQGMPFGIRDVDRKIGGLLGGDVCVIAGRPGMGKTTMAQNIAQYLCEDYKSRVVIFSLEMKDVQIMARMLASEAKIKFSRFRSSHFAEADWPKLTEAAGRMSAWKCHIEDATTLSSFTPLDLRTALQRITMTHGKPDLVIVDYLQLMEATKPARNRVDEVSQISRHLKSLAMYFDIPFVVLSQLSRKVEERPNKRPMLSDLRESGAIEQDADIVGFLYDDAYYDEERGERKGGPCEFIIAKQRMGPIGTVKIHFDLESARFEQAHAGATGRKTFRKRSDLD